VAKVILRDFWVDDLLSGAPDEQSARQLQQKLYDVLKEKHFELRKFSCSVAEIVSALPSKLRENEHAFTLNDPNHIVKTLGIEWKPIEDVFTFTVNACELDEKLTKRDMLSDMSKVFDPLGWLIPVTLKLKLIMQATWIQGVEWDTVLPKDVSGAFLAWRQELPILKELKINRCVLTPIGPCDFELHVFCDASQLAYAACVYILVHCGTGNTQVSLLTAKGKVAPLKSTSIPRLELCAALLGAKLLSTVLRALNRLDLTPKKVQGWTDSTVVLSWLSEIPRQWNVFVANRVSQIQEVLPSSKWLHVGTKDNPADVATRGVKSYEFLKYDLWWKGPSWLAALQNPEQPKWRSTSAERRRAPIIALQISGPCEVSASNAMIDLATQSNLAKTLRVLCGVFRFVGLLRKKVHGLKAPELREKALRFLVREEQFKHYEVEIKALQSGKQVSTTSSILSLYPFLDGGVLKVGGRLAAGEHLSENIRYPMILHKTSLLSQLIITDIHKRYLHAGAQTCLSELRRNFWIIGAKSLIRKHIRNCVKCFRFNSRATTPLMGDLPKERVTPSPPFTHTGVDFGGPFCVRGAKGENTSKAYLALFVCFTTKALHLELVSSLSAQACIAAFRRFAARRGAPSHMYSDNGTNFTGARRELALLQSILEQKFGRNSMPNAAAELGSTWSTIPPGSPHWGGLWEAGIKSAKTHLRKIMGKNVLTFEEFTTVLCDIESVLNSRPLVQLSDDVKDLRALTPGMLVTGKDLKYVPVAVPSVLSEKIPRDSDVHPQRRWAFLQNLVANFWKRWTREYLTTLQTRPKWRKEIPNLQVGDLVLVTDENLPPLQWPLGRILNTYTGNDEICRAARVKTSKGTYNRPVVKLRRLPIKPTESEGKVSFSV
jgi:hypothetical protein